MASALTLQAPLSKCVYLRTLDDSRLRGHRGCRHQAPLTRARTSFVSHHQHRTLSQRHSASSSPKVSAVAEETQARREAGRAPESSGSGFTTELPVASRLNTSKAQQSSSDFLLLSSAAVVIPLLAEGPGYSQASYYTSLGLFLLSLPGLWSLIKRSTASKVVRKTFVVPGPSVPGAKPLKLLAGEITAALAKSNFKIINAGETITFEGVFLPNRGQAAFLTFCAAVGLASLALVLTIVAPDLGEWWYLITLLSPAAGVYYWTRATRTEQIQIKMVTADDEKETDVILQGDDEEIERVRKGLALMEKGKVYVKGLLEQ